VSQRSFSESRRTTQEDVLENVTSLPGRRDHQFDALADLNLARELAESGWPQRYFKGGIGFQWFHLR
jgi:hypothetical protein